MADKHIFETMNGLRGFAALAVVGLHWLDNHPNLANGFLAVDLFFVLSGFVIAHSYENRLRSGLPVGEFFLIRLIRLYPLYLLGTLLSVLALAMSFLIHGRMGEIQIAGVHSIPRSLFMLPTPPQTNEWSEAHLYPLNYPAWSLFFELLINFAFSMTFRWWTDVRIFKSLLIFGPALLLYHIVTGVPFAHGWNWATVPMGLLRVLYSFPAGVLIYRLYQKRSAYLYIPSPIIVGIFICLIVLPSTRWAPFSILIGFPLLVLLAAYNEPKGILSSVFASLGTASYAIYAIHEPLHAFIAAAFVKLGLPLGMAVNFALILLIIPICLLVDKLYDAPLRKYLAHKLLRRSRASYFGAKTKSEPAAHSLAE